MSFFLKPHRESISALSPEIDVEGKKFGCYILRKNLFIYLELFALCQKFSLEAGSYN
jgi:hypothetical protein